VELLAADRKREARDVPQYLILFSLGAAAMAGDVDAGASETLRNSRGGYGASRRSAVETVFERVGALDVAGLLAEGERDAHHER